MGCVFDHSTDCRKDAANIMPGRTAPEIHVTPTQEGILRKIARRHSGEQRQVRRARLILEMVSGATIAATARRHGADRRRVSIWRQRFRKAEARLAAVEAEGDGKALRQAIEQLLDDSNSQSSRGSLGGSVHLYARAGGSNHRRSL